MGKGDILLMVLWPLKISNRQFKDFVDKIRNDSLGLFYQYDG